MAVKLKHVESALSGVETFRTPKVDLEQYPTSAHLAARMLYTAAMSFDDVVDCHVCDLGCGTGMLSAAALYLGAGAVTAVELDDDALGVLRENLEGLELDADVVQADVARLPLPEGCVDTVVTNPPFGTRRVGIDTVFVLQGARVARRAVYSLHKTSTRSHFAKVAARIGAGLEVLAELRFDIGRMYDHHTRDSVDVQVDLLRFDVSSVDAEAVKALLEAGPSAPESDAAASLGVAERAGRPGRGGRGGRGARSSRGSRGGRGGRGGKRKGGRGGGKR